MATELFAADRAVTTVTSGGTTAPAGGTQETWTVASSAMFGAASAGVTQFHVADPAAPSEIIAVTNVSGTTWTVTRGAESTTPVAHSAGFTAYQVVTAGFLATLSPLPLRLIYADAYGADPTGTADSTTAIVAAQAAGGSGAYLIVLAAGTYKWGTSGDIGVFGRNQGIIAQGSAHTTVSYRGNGTCIAAFDSSFSPSLSAAGRFGGFNIDGTSAGSSATGMSWGDMLRGRCSDIRIANFTGASATGLQFKNAAGWSEEAEWTGINLNNNTVNVLYDTGSFDYSLYQFVVEANANQDGLRLQNNASLEGCRLEVRGNFQTGVTNTAAVIAIDRGNSGGTSRIDGCQIYLNCECDGLTGTGHYTLLMGGSSVSQFTGTGVFQFPDSITQQPFQGASLATGTQLGFSGRVMDHVLGLMMPGDALVVQGGSQWTEYGSLSTALPSTLFVKSGDVFSALLASGANALAFSGALQRSRRLDMFLAQPASGAAGTVTWPGNVIFPGGQPRLSQVNGAVDHVRLVYLPSIANWYGELIGDAYGTAATAETDVSTTAETTIAAFTLPAGLAAAATYRFTAWGTVSIGEAADTFGSRLRLGGISGSVIGGENVSAAFSGAGTGSFLLEGTITLRAPGSSATYAGYCKQNLTVSGAPDNSQVIAGTVTKNSTVTQQLVLTLKLSGTSTAACLGSLLEPVA